MKKTNNNKYPKGFAEIQYVFIIKNTLKIYIQKPALTYSPSWQEATVRFLKAWFKAIWLINTSAFAGIYQ